MDSPKNQRRHHSGIGGRFPIREPARDKADEFWDEVLAKHSEEQIDAAERKVFSGLSERDWDIWERSTHDETVLDIAGDLEINKNTVRAVINKTKKRIEEELGVRPKTTDYSLDDIVSAADTSAKEAVLDEAVRKATADLDTTGQAVWKLRYEKKLSEHKIADKLGIGYGSVRKILLDIREDILTEIDGKITVTEKTPDKVTEMWERAQTEHTPAELEGAEKTVRGDFSERDEDIWKRYGQGQRGTRIGKDLNVKTRTVRAVIEKVKRLIEEELGVRPKTADYTLQDIVKAADSPAKTKALQEAIRTATADLDPIGKKVWKMRYEEEKSFRQIGEEVGKNSGAVRNIIMDIQEDILTEINRGK